MSKSIQKPWVAFGYLTKDSMGYICQESIDSIHVQYSEGQLYPTESWDKSYVKSFSTPEELAKYVYAEWGTYRYEEAMQLLKEKFPKQFKKKR